ncbi:hypothetical protein KEM52_003191 [Ascosphaera acerosa]|nr:hypothetical protein KEM52_003191 [Ascosphaera acerosa]
MGDLAHSRAYAPVAFLAGAIVAVGAKELLYPELKRRLASPQKRGTAEGSTDSTTEPPRQPSRADTPPPQLRDGPPPIVDGIEGCIGNTHLVRIKSLSDATGCDILAKAEFLNGAGNSPKDRVALSMIQAAEEQGLLHPYSGDTIYEGTSGSTGISLATLARAKGYLAHICLPSDQAVEKSDLLLKLGAEVDRVPPAPIVESGNFVNQARRLAHEHSSASSSSSSSASSSSSSSSLAPTGSLDRDDSPALEARAGDTALESAILAAKTGRGFFTDQFENPANWRAHYSGTGPEIYAQCEGQLDAFVAGAGTGGTLSGVALYLKPRLPDVRIVLADPPGSGLYNKVKYGVMWDVKEKEGTRRRRQVDTLVEGIGVNRITQNFDAGRELVDDAVRVTDAQALAMARWLVEKDGIFVGSSSAVNCFAAVKTALQLGPGHRVVTLLCDSGTRHLSKFWKVAGDVGGATSTTIEDVLNAKASDFGI